MFGIIYHIGDGCKSGHYFAKQLTFENSVETYDDSRCYLNPIENSLSSKNAYIIFFQKSSSNIQNNPKVTQKVEMIEEINQYIDQFIEKGFKSFEIRIQNKLNETTIPDGNKSPNCIKPKKSNEKKNHKKYVIQKQKAQILKKINLNTKTMNYLKIESFLSKLMNFSITILIFHHYMCMTK